MRKRISRLQVLKLQAWKPFGSISVWLTRENSRKVTLLWLISEIQKSDILNQHLCYADHYRVIDHPDYTEKPPDMDFSLLHLSDPVDFNNPSLSHVFPACWPSAEPQDGTMVCFLLKRILIKLPLGSLPGSCIWLGRYAWRWKPTSKCNARGCWKI